VGVEEGVVWLFVRSAASWSFSPNHIPIDSRPHHQVGIISNSRYNRGIFLFVHDAVTGLVDPAGGHVGSSNYHECIYA
jgi:hypothetical protein